MVYREAVDVDSLFVVNLVHWTLGSHYATASINELTRSTAWRAQVGHSTGTTDTAWTPWWSSVPAEYRSIHHGLDWDRPKVPSRLSINKWTSHCLPTRTKLVFIRNHHQAYQQFFNSVRLLPPVISIPAKENAFMSRKITFQWISVVFWILVLLLLLRYWVLTTLLYLFWAQIVTLVL